MSRLPRFATAGTAFAVAVIAVVGVSGCGSVERKLTLPARLPTQTATAGPAVPSAGSSSLPSSQRSSPPSSLASAAPSGPSARAQPRATSASYMGVYVPGVPGSYAPVAAFAHAVGAWPRIVMYYSQWYEKFYTSFATAAYQRHAVVLVQLQPQGSSLAQVAAGRDDAYLISYARQVRAFGHQVIIGFGHEMNGGWYDWGAGHVSPAVFVAAWRHVVAVFRAEGALNVTWLWTVNSINAASSPLRLWWPGAAWVNWVGIDGYYYHPSDTYASVFGSTIAAVRRFTAAPVLISEVAAGPNAAQVAQINGLFAGIRSSHILGLVWFDRAQHAGVYHQDWRLENSPAALGAFRADAADLYR